MYTISKRFAFSASHVIGGLPSDHPCGRLHGHNYQVEVYLQSAALDHTGFVRDFHELSELKQFIDRTLDHQASQRCPWPQSHNLGSDQPVALQLVQGALARGGCCPRRRDAKYLGGISAMTAGIPISEIFGPNGAR